MKQTRFRPGDSRPCIKITAHAWALFFCTLLLLTPTAIFADTTVGGTISVDTPWTRTGSPYVVTSSITVVGTDGDDGITTLTIEAGVEVRFESNCRLAIGYGGAGALVAQGTTANPIVFTSNNQSPAPGAWIGVRFYQDTDPDTTIMQNCRIQYAGNDYGAVYIDNASPDFTNVVVENSGYHDFYYNGTVGGTVSDCTLHSGIYFESSATSSVVFTNNLFYQNNNYPTETYADNVHSLVNGNTFDNLDADSHLIVKSGNITKDAIWTAAIPIYLKSSCTVKGASGLATLTLEPGAELRFGPNCRLAIGDGGPGALIAQGTSANPVIFTSNNQSPSPGAWIGVRFYQNTDPDTTIMQNCRIQYAGNEYGAVYINNASPDFTNVVIEDSGYHDFYYDGSVGGTVSDCKLHSGILFNTATNSVVFTGNLFYQNNNYPTETYADLVHGLVNGNGFDNVDADSYMIVKSGNITKDAVWTAAIPYHITYTPMIQGQDGADGITTLTVKPGAVLKFKANMALNVGASSGAPGALIAQGSSDAPILFSVISSAPQAGNWVGVFVNPTSNETGTLMDHCIVEYAGYYYNNGIRINDSDAIISNTTIRSAQGYGLRAINALSSAAQITCNTFDTLDNGLIAESDALPTIEMNNFTNITGYDIVNSSAATLIAENNWWDDPNGPDQVQGSVDVEPWAATINQCNEAPNAPNSLAPADLAVRVQVQGGVGLSWICSDLNSGDTLTYDVYIGISVDDLQVAIQDLNNPSYLKTGLSEGTTYFWQVIAKDNTGLSTQGPIWQFTTGGDPPDLTVASFSTFPAGAFQVNSWVTLIATIANNGSGPVVDSFDTNFSAGSTSIGTVTTNQVIAPGGSVQATVSWYYTGGDATLAVTTDSGATVTETNESNNQLQVLLSTVADITPPALISSNPDNGSTVQPVQSINFTLIDTQSDIDDTAVLAAFSLVDAKQQPVEGQISESNDSFTFVPDSVPLSEGDYQASVTASDIIGNNQIYNFSFIIDATPPAKPVIIGDAVTSGTIQPRPASNSAQHVAAVLQGTREDQTSLWINGELFSSIGSGPWSCQIALNPGDNSFEVISKDEAGNASESEWVDIHYAGQGGTVYQYDTAGRIRQIKALP